MKLWHALAAATSMFGSAPAMAATAFEFDLANSFVEVTSNQTSCRLLGNCALSASLASLPGFTLDVGESRTFDFANFFVSRGIGTGSASVDAQLAFLSPSAAPAGSTANASYFRVGGLFTPGVLGGSLLWNTTTQQLSTGNGGLFTVSFGDLVGARFGGNSTAPVTITLNSAGAVPEPATWAMMILGVGMAGGALRSARRRSVRVTFATA